MMLGDESNDLISVDRYLVLYICMKSRAGSVQLGTSQYLAKLRILLRQWVESCQATKIDGAQMILIRNISREWTLGFPPTIKSPSLPREVYYALPRRLSET